eukprot:m51a1_g988 hypothetical protein (1149) ;mRNA; r:472587-477313
MSEAQTQAQETEELREVSREIDELANSLDEGLAQLPQATARSDRQQSAAAIRSYKIELRYARLIANAQQKEKLRGLDAAADAFGADLDLAERDLPPAPAVLYVATVLLASGRVLSERLSARHAALSPAARTSALALAATLRGPAAAGAAPDASETTPALVLRARAARGVAVACALAAGAEPSYAARVLDALARLHETSASAALERLRAAPASAPGHAAVVCARTGAELRAERVRVRALVTESGARVSLRAAVANAGAEAAEALLALPLPPGAAVVALGARGDDGRPSDAARVLDALARLHETSASAALERLRAAPAAAPGHAAVVCARTGAELRAERVRVRALVTESGARVSLRAAVANAGAEAAEALLALPLPPGAAVVALGARGDDGRVLAGELRGRGAAQALYDDAVAGGAGAALLEQSRCGDGAVFTAALGALLPGRRLELSVEWVADVRVLLGRRVSFAIPASAMPAAAQSPRGAGDDGAGAPADALGLAGLEGEVAVECDMRGSGCDIAEVALAPPCEWPVSVAREGPQRATLSLAAPVLPAGDLCVSVLLAQRAGGASRAVVERSAATASACVMAALRVPDEAEAADAPRAREVVFVVDRSGSMAGAKMLQVRDALRLFLGSLPVGSLFNIHVDGMDANLGGTELLSPLTYVLGASVRADVARCVFVLTDGAVERPDDAVRCVKKRRDPSRCRVFALGIGDDCSRPLVQSLADASGGLAEFSEGEGRIEPLVMRLLGSALRHSLTQLSVEWPAVLRLQLSSPEPLPRAVLCGETLRVYAVVDAAEDLRGKCVALVGTPVGRSRAPVRVELPLDGAVQTEGSLLHTLCARQFVRDHSGEEHREAVTAVATRFGIASPYTSFVVVERREGAQQQGSLVQAHLAPPESSAVIDPASLDALMCPADATRAALLRAGDVQQRDVAILREALATVESTKCIGVDTLAQLSTQRETLQCACDSVDRVDRSSSVLRRAGRLFSRLAGSLFAGASAQPAVCSTPARCVAPDCPAASPSAQQTALQPVEHQAPQVLKLTARGLLQELVRAQDVAGFWSPELLCKALRVDVATLLAAAPAELGDTSGDGDALRVWATALAMAVLEELLSGLSDEWELLHDKASGWLQTHGGTASVGVAAIRGSAVFARPLLY